MTLSPTPRSIIHVDLDAFFCSVEELLDPEIRGQPVIVGADPGGRGVVATASYAARHYGVHSAMPITKAARLCPNAFFRRPRHELYCEYSDRVMTLLGEYTPVVEQTSIDEAFLDVTGSRQLFGPADDIGHAIQRRVLEEVGLACTVGIAANKLVSKIASESGKPYGFVMVPPGEEARFLGEFGVERLLGVGPKTASRLRVQGIRTIGDLAALPIETLRALFAQMGEHLHRRAQGIDDSPVEPNRQRKSISKEHTFTQDTGDMGVVEAKLLELSESVASVLRKGNWRARTVSLKLRYSDFTTVSRNRTLRLPTDLGATIFDVGTSLLRPTQEREPLVRLVGIGVGNLIDAETQPGLFDLEDEKERSLARTADSLRARFGSKAVRRGRIVG